MMMAARRWLEGGAVERLLLWHVLRREKRERELQSSGFVRDRGAAEESSAQQQTASRQPHSSTHLITCHLIACHCHLITCHLTAAPPLPHRSHHSSFSPNDALATAVDARSQTVADEVVARALRFQPPPLSTCPAPPAPPMRPTPHHPKLDRLASATSPAPPPQPPTPPPPSTPPPCPPTCPTPPSTPSRRPSAPARPPPVGLLPATPARCAAVAGRRSRSWRVISGCTVRSGRSCASTVAAPSRKRTTGERIRRRAGRGRRRRERWRGSPRSCTGRCGWRGWRRCRR